MSNIESSVAIIGMSGRFPQAENIDEFWHNLQNGIESISVFSDQELIANGHDPSLVNNPKYIKASAVLSDIEKFDAAFFGFSPQSAAIMDPQQRLFLECAWSALENAGYHGEIQENVIGVYAGTGMNTYLLNNLYGNDHLLKSVSHYQIIISNDKDFLPTRVSFQLNLTGPSVNVQTACSTSLVAVHLASQSLLSGECDLVLAGGVSIRVPHQTGYLYQEGMIMSGDGHCRPFDAKAQGTVVGNGLGIVVLKRLEEAIADGDTIHAIIRGSAINNDGGIKVGYTAPSIKGQKSVILESQAIADIEPETITYIETHGTGTPLGDPIEIEALKQAFSTAKTGSIAIGSLKSNMGHLDAAAGIASLIKTVLALKHKLIPPSLHFDEPNPQINFANSPFYVNTQLRDWKSDNHPRRAGVSSFGIGGTNAHIILEEAPQKQPSGESRTWQILPLSAKTSTSLDQARVNLENHLREHPDINLADVAYTLQLGRKTLPHRRIVICSDPKNAIYHLANLSANNVFTEVQDLKERAVVFMFAGQGSQYVNMAKELYQQESTFRQQIDICSSILLDKIGLDIRDILYPKPEFLAAATNKIKQTSIAQPILFTIEYALAQQWYEWGIRPTAAIGHSLGEYVAATIAGVFSLENGLSLVAKRGKLMQELPKGAMLAVPLSETQIQPLLGDQLSLAAINSPSQSVISGTIEAIAELNIYLQQQGIESHILHTSHAFHSAMMSPIMEQFTEEVKKYPLNPPQIPYISNVTGNWIEKNEAVNPHYWVRHLRETVRFGEGLEKLLKDPHSVLLEVAPGRTLTSLAKRHPGKQNQQIILNSIPHPQEQESDLKWIITTLGKLWLAGVKIDWLSFWSQENRYRLPLPTYAFERQRYWIEPPHLIHSQPLESGQNSQQVEHLSLDLTKDTVVISSELEKQIADIWCEFLGIRQIKREDDFFDLGGDSLLAVQLISVLKEKFQLEISPNSLLQVRTIAAMATLIENKEVEILEVPSQLPSSLVEIKKLNNKKLPLFLVHPVGGTVYIYRDLANCLDRSVYGLQAEGLDEKTKPLTTIEDMADYYLNALSKFQPESPYLLGGSSFGGLVALEMAQKLWQNGQKVPLLMMIDTPGLEQMPKPLLDDAEIITYLLDVGANISVSSDYLRTLNSDEQILDFYNQIKLANNLIPNLNVDTLRRYLDIFKINSQAMLNYVPQKYPGKIIFFRACERDAITPIHPEYAWIDLALAGIEIYSVSGNHITMNYHPHVQLIASHLNSYLDNIAMLNDS